MEENIKDSEMLQLTLLKRQIQHVHYLCLL
jgi:hypothetical protein